MPRISIIATALVLVAPSAWAAEQTGLYDATGRSIGTAVPYSDGSIRFYDAHGRSLGTSSTSSSGTQTFYDAGGNKIGTAAKPRKR